MSTQAIPATSGGAEHAMIQRGAPKVATWIKKRENLATRPTWQELFDYGSGCCKWVVANNSTENECFTSSTNSCYVATLCYHHWDPITDTEHWEVFHSTIPRVPFFNQLLGEGDKEAPIWHAAAKKCRADRREVHAGDGTLYCFEREHKTYPEPGQEQLRMVVCGVIKGGSTTPERRQICSNCQTIGATPQINVRFLLKGKPSELDEKDVEQKLVQTIRQQQENQRQLHRQQQEPRSRPSTAGSGKSTSTNYSDIFDGKEVIKSDGTIASRPGSAKSSPGKQQPPRGGTSANPVGPLTRHMGALNIGRHGPVQPPGRPGSRPFSAQAPAGNSALKPTALGRPSPAPPALMDRNPSARPPVRKPAGPGTAGSGRPSNGPGAKPAK